MNMEPDEIEPLAPRGAPADVARRGEGHAELVGAQAGRNVRMAPGVDVGVHAQRDARPRFAGRRQAIDPVQFPFGFGVDRLHTEVDGLHQFSFSLADAGEDDVGRNEAGAQGDVDLAAGVRIGLRAEPAQQPRDRQRRIRLQGIVQGVRIRHEGRIDLAIAGDDGFGAVDVEGGAFDRSDPCERHAVTGERAVQSVKSSHVQKILSEPFDL